MTNNDFVAFVADTFDQLKVQFIEKNKQYGDIDALANFRKGAALRYGDDSANAMYKTALDYETKHVAHVFGHNAFGDKIDESLKDIAIYSIIELYLVEKAKKEYEDVMKCR